MRGKETLWSLRLVSGRLVALVPDISFPASGEQVLSGEVIGIGCVVCPISIVAGPAQRIAEAQVRSNDASSFAWLVALHFENPWFSKP